MPHLLWNSTPRWSSKYILHFTETLPSATLLFLLQPRYWEAAALHSTAQKPFKVCHLDFYDCSTAFFKKIQKSSSAIAKPVSLANGFEGSLWSLEFIPCCLFCVHRYHWSHRAFPDFQGFSTQDNWPCFSQWLDTDNPKCSHSFTSVVM